MSIHVLHPQFDEIIEVLATTGNSSILSDIHEIDISGLNTHQFSMLANANVSDMLEKRARYLIPSEDKSYYHEFIVMESYTNHERKQIYAKGSFQDINTQNIIRPQTYTAWSVNDYVRHALNNTEWELGTVDFVGVRTATFERYLGAYDFLNELRAIFNYEFEMQYRVQVENNRIIGRYVDILAQIGNDTGKELVYGKDIIDIQKRVYNERIVTQLIALGPIREDGTRLQATVANKEAFNRWNRNGYHITSIYEPVVETPPDELTLNQLRYLAERELNNRIDSIVEYTVDAISLDRIFPHERVHLGDRIRIKDTEFVPPIYAEARVINIRRSLMDDAQKTFTIGQLIEYQSETVYRTVKEMQKLTGFRIVRSAEPPPGTGDAIWINTAVQPNTAYTWNNDQWEKLTPSTAEEIGAETPAGAQEKANTAQTNAQNYADQKDTQLTTTLRGEISAVTDDITTISTQKANAAQTNAQAYADQKDTQLATTLRGEISAVTDDITTISTQKANAAQTNAQNYANQKDAQLAATLRSEMESIAGGGGNTDNILGINGKNALKLNDPDWLRINTYGDYRQGTYVGGEILRVGGAFEIGTYENGVQGYRVSPGTEPQTHNKERGFCGYGTRHGGVSTGTQAGGVGVNFRIKKSYVPSTVTFTKLAAYGLEPNVAQITEDGFWLYMTASIGGYTGHAYWRGYYEA